VVVDHLTAFFHFASQDASFTVGACPSFTDWVIQLESNDVDMGRKLFAESVHAQAPILIFFQELRVFFLLQKSIARNTTHQALLCQQARLCQEELMAQVHVVEGAAHACFLVLKKFVRALLPWLIKEGEVTEVDL